MYSIKVGVDVALFASALANASSHEQSELFNVFSQELWIAVKGKRSLQEAQSNYIVSEMTERAEDLILELAEFVNLRRSEK